MLPLSAWDKGTVDKSRVLLLHTTYLCIEVLNASTLDYHVCTAAADPSCSRWGRIDEAPK